MSRARLKLYVSCLFTICVIGTLIYFTSSFEKKVANSKNIVAINIEQMINDNPTASGDYDDTIETGPTVDDDVLEFLKK